MTKKLFVVGTGTDVGKTYVSSLIIKKLHDAGLNAAYYKVAMSGNTKTANGEIIPGDACFVKKCQEYDNLLVKCVSMYMKCRPLHTLLQDMKKLCKYARN